ncbi:MAG: SIS domain-containing protein [Alphaproteobacteria bacterium]
MEFEIGKWATFQEIMRQPDVWADWSDTLAATAGEIQRWIARREPGEIWFCGAGSSSFIGAILTPYLNTNCATRFRSVPTTDLVACPSDYIDNARRPLVVSISRSGESSETIGTLDLLDLMAPKADRLDITCNATSTLATRLLVGAGEQRKIVLPAACHDTGFAMTVSFTTMALTVLACMDQHPPLPVGQTLRKLAEIGANVLATDLKHLGLHRPPSRAVFLGSGVLCGAAREAALKVLELTRGQVATFAGSPLGFRHGPKAFINDDTKVFIFVSNHPTTRKYDLDLAAEIANQFGPDKVVTLGAPEFGPTVGVPTIGNDAWTSVLYVLLAQLLSVHWSGALGLNIDNPFLSDGNLTRIVSDVALHLPEPV